MTLPCRHQQNVTQQVQPTIDLLGNLDLWHPDVLTQHSINPIDYKSGLVFRSAIESIRGTFIASSTTRREGLIRDLLENLIQRAAIANFEQLTNSRRYDFTIAFNGHPQAFAALEVKGGEGNSVNLSERPIWAREFAVWCHLDGAIVNQPSKGAHSIVSRLTSELVRRHKLVDVLFFKDILCGTRARPCPKYPGEEDSIGLRAAPDIFLFPSAIPTTDNPAPDVHSLDSLTLPRLFLDLFDVPRDQQYKHVWEVHVTLRRVENGRHQKSVEVWHQGELVDTGTSRPWSP